MLKVEHELFLDNHHKVFGMGAEPCRLCDKCNLDNCVNLMKARPAMEACGIDVYTTVKNNGFPIKVLKEEQCQGN